MLTKEQVEQSICWIEDNSIDLNILQKYVSENSNTIEQLTSKYTVEHNNIYKKQLNTPMTKNIFMYMYDLCKKKPHTFHNCNINIDNNIVHSKKQEYIHLPQILQKIEDKNCQLLKENREMLKKHTDLLIKYEDLLKENAYIMRQRLKKEQKEIVELINNN